MVPRLAAAGRLAGAFTGVLAVAGLLGGCAAHDGRPAAAAGTAAAPSSPAPSSPAPSSLARPSSTAPSSPARPSSTAPLSSIAPPARVPVSPCATTSGQGRRVIVSVRRQHAWMCDGHRTADSTPVTTGAVDLAYDATPTGTFHIQARQTHQVLTLVSGARYTVRYWIPFDAPLYGFHDAPWQTMPYGSPKFRTKGSHGCVHLPLAAMRFLYRWARVGTPVHISR